MHGLDDASDRGMGELSTIGTSHIEELRSDGSIVKTVITPRDVGLQPGRFEDLASARDVKHNALMLLGVILGKDDGPRSDIICLNTAPLLYVMGKAKDIREGIDMARHAVRNGQALKKLREWVSSQNVTPADGLSVLDRMIAEA
jgi:anthranilate phosphoribosyltransferase